MGIQYHGRPKLQQQNNRDLAQKNLVTFEFPITPPEEEALLK
jgi:hypothetical protein